MSLSGFLASLTWGSSTTSSRTEIENAISLLYTSPSGKNMVDFIYSTGKNIEFRSVDGIGSKVGDPSTSSPIVNIDVEQIDTHSFIDSSGVVHQLDFVHAVVHELIHLSGPIGMPYPGDIDSADFSTPGTDYVGDTVRIEQGIFDELGLPSRNSYVSMVENTDLAALGADADSLTGNEAVGIVVSDISDLNEIDLSDRTDSVLVLGNSGDDYILGGAGADFLYGGEGHDNIEGGDGNDLIVGGAGADVLYGGDGDDIIVGGKRVHGAFGEIYVENDEAGDMLIGGAGYDTYYISGAFGDYTRALTDIYSGPLNTNVFSYIDIINDEDGSGKIFGKFGNVFGDDTLNYVLDHSADGISHYNMQGGDYPYAGYTLLQTVYNGHNYLLFTEGEEYWVEFAIYDFSSGDFGIYLS